MTASYLSLLLADGRLPTGAHTQSAGVEPALRHGMRVDEVPAYLRVRLATVVEVEAAAAVVAGHVWTSGVVRAGCGASTVVEALAEVDAAWRVRTLSDALREASDLLGRSYLRTAAAVWDLTPFATAAGPWCRAVVLGVVAAEAGLDAEQTARLVAYEDVQTVVAAALKLEPFDPSVGVRWAADAAVAVEALVSRVVDARTTTDIPAHSAPLVEEWGQHHKTSERRLFRA
ncbi:urease accessory protein UreF [Microlunatus antarcticus]|uniref:Urease accessory protein n=1 Tax=Microlunatus antarcticus TaxID=53388 RepID=A0A7W5JY01_9ACTN|nr:urease accessory UreF family protein [Microlunatus antarcticus]MBB3328365.1 urease accessory protein [Microlunatus antarcticus]